MQTISAFLLFIFNLAVGPAASDAKQYELLKGDWVIEKVISDGKVLPAKEWKGKKVSFFTDETAVAKGSATFGGRLRTKGNMAWLETKTITIPPTQGTGTEPTVLEEEYSGAYEIEGKKMTLLLTRVTDPSKRGPRPVKESKGEDGALLFFLKKIK